MAGLSAELDIFSAESGKTALWLTPFGSIWFDVIRQNFGENGTYILNIILFAIGAGIIGICLGLIVFFVFLIWRTNGSIFEDCLNNNNTDKGLAVCSSTKGFWLWTYSLLMFLMVLIIIAMLVLAALKGPFAQE